SMRFDGGNKEAADAIERESSRPDFQALIYPGSSRRVGPAQDPPPAFLVCGCGDRPDSPQGHDEIRLEYQERGTAEAPDTYGTAGYGLGVGDNNTKAVGKWPARFEEWLGDLGFLQKP